ncbi:MAG TPA: porin family protein [Chitinophagales bacterium]|nr:porin family protein [Chitinophagales bacterium]HMW12929.1 porin family protein [Chitinophagales bacterium]HMZ33625.1 porin family protein [Chitinophagales bacterium]HNF18710.1 porin family protein [Chitinophagales bacterium]HNG72080.1 porin family protein [Chitinophagales bacterium]
MKRLFSIISFYIFMLVSAYAEVGVSVGAKAGFDVAFIRKYPSPYTYSKRAILGSDISAVLRIDFNKFIGLQTELEFIQKGQGWKNSNDSAKFNAKKVLNYVQFPILAVACVGSQKVKAVFFLGPYLAYQTGGYLQESVSVDKQSKNSITSKYLFSPTDNRFDVGMIIGAGTNIKVGKGWIEVAARQDIGMMPLVKLKSGLPKTYNCNFNLSIAYLYTIK